MSTIEISRIPFSRTPCPGPSEPAIRHGEDLDLPTYIRKGVALN